MRAVIVGIFAALNVACVAGNFALVSISYTSADTNSARHYVAPYSCSTDTECVREELARQTFNQ